MQPDQRLAVLQREDPHATARSNEAVAQQAVTDTPEREHGYAHLLAPLRQRGLECTVEYGLSDYIVRAELPDGSTVIVSPPQEPPTDHPPGYPESWLVTHGHPDDPAVHEVIYDSEFGGPDARHGGSITHLLTAINARLDQQGGPPRSDPLGDDVAERRSDPGGVQSQRVGAARTVSPAIRRAAPAARPEPPVARPAVLSLPRPSSVPGR